MTLVTRRLEFDAGHRVPRHAGQCRRPHGHRYAVEVTVNGDVAEDGMVVDFGVLKQVMVEQVHDVLDHRFLCARSDVELINALEGVYPDCVVVLDRAPTAENLAEWVGLRVGDALPPELVVQRVTVWETPNCSAVWSGWT